MPRSTPSPGRAPCSCRRKAAGPEQAISHRWRWKRTATCSRSPCGSCGWCWRRRPAIRPPRWCSQAMRRGPAERFTAHVVVDVDRLAASDLAGLWPARVGGDSRAWLTENITAGLVHDGHITFTMAGAANGDDLDLTQAGGGITGDDITVWWLRPAPPVEHGHVIVAWQDPDTMLLTVTGARQGAIASRLTTVKLTGLAGNHQFANIDADLAGPLAAVFTLLKHPRLNLLSKHPVPITNPSGTVTDQLSVPGAARGQRDDRPGADPLAWPGRRRASRRHHRRTRPGPRPADGRRHQRRAERDGRRADRPHPRDADRDDGFPPGAAQPGGAACHGLRCGSPTAMRARPGWEWSGWMPGW